MAKLYSCCFPDHGVHPPDGYVYMADGAREAAEKAAAEKCRRDVEWRHLRVVVECPDGKLRGFDVQVQSVPEFVATETRP